MGLPFKITLWLKKSKDKKSPDPSKKNQPSNNPMGRERAGPSNRNQPANNGMGAERAGPDYDIMDLQTIDFSRMDKFKAMEVISKHIELKRQASPMPVRHGAYHNMLAAQNAANAAKANAVDAQSAIKPIDTETPGPSSRRDTSSETPGPSSTRDTSSETLEIPSCRLRAASDSQKVNPFQKIKKATTAMLSSKDKVKKRLKKIADDEDEDEDEKRERRMSVCAGFCRTRKASYPDGVTKEDIAALNLNYKGNCSQHLRSAAVLYDNLSDENILVIEQARARAAERRANPFRRNAIANVVVGALAQGGDSLSSFASIINEGAGAAMAEASTVMAPASEKIREVLSSIPIPESITDRIPALKFDSPEEYIPTPIARTPPPFPDPTPPPSVVPSPTPSEPNNENRRLITRQVRRVRGFWTGARNRTRNISRRVSRTGRSIYRAGRTAVNWAWIPETMGQVALSHHKKQATQGAIKNGLRHLFIDWGIGN